MNGETPFFKTAMGREFFDRTMPTLVKELQKLNENLAKIIKQNEAQEKTDAEPRGDGGR